MHTRYCPTLNEFSPKCSPQNLAKTLQGDEIGYARTTSSVLTPEQLSLACAIMVFEGDQFVSIQIFVLTFQYRSSEHKDSCGPGLEIVAEAEYTVENIPPA
eukprot:2330039-Rhodomonas_salina.1